MRRLLVFGTGAAVIGIVLLIVAFYEAYLIVSTLQREVGNQVTNTNLLLEDATLEAVFLGVMAALGYGLVAKGLDGIRRQELLEMESTAEVTYGRGQIGGNQIGLRVIERSDAVPPPSKPDLHPGIKSAGAAAAPQTSSRASARPVQEFPAASDKKLAPVWGAPSTRLQEPTGVADSGINPSDVSDGSATEGGPSEKPSSVVQSEAQEGLPVNPATQPSDDGPQNVRTGEVIWEGGAPPDLAGLEAVPGPTGQSPDVSTGQEPSASIGSSPEPSTDPVTGLPAAPKRRRGRPKGSKSSKKVPESSSSDSSQPSQPSTPNPE